MEDNTGNVASVESAKHLGFFARLGIKQLNPFARNADVADPYATYRAEDDRLAHDFVVDAESAIIAQDPVRARRGVRAVFFAVIVLLLWAAFAQVDEITKGEGKAVSSRQLQVVQSLDGGIVNEILAKEGDRVREGQVLVKIDTTRFLSNLNESRATYLALLAKAARLRAVADGREFVPPPEVLKENPALADQERAVYLNRRAELNAQVGMARDQLSQREHELSEAQARHDQAQQGYALTSRELAMTRPLIKSGAVSDVELLRLERDVSRLEGEMKQADSQITRLQSAMAEARKKIEGVELEFRNQARNELSETQAKINSLGEGNVALSDKVKQADIRSPVNGTVQRLLYNTVGGVVQPGKDIIEIVPLDDTILLEAKVLPKDIAFLHPGQKANVKFTAYDFAIYGGLEAHVENISADSVMDDKGNTFYVVRVRTVKSSIGENMPIIPGMIAEVDILTGKKTVLSYLLKPVLRAKQYALTER
ncbi:MAG: HlyD family type I secretion periplasmic adaptor subunit [Nitrosomonadales bacterium]|nr:HlyD family type I secretion periplasmic adaptor subunit [Nitrosomonadales bacterium]